VLQATPADHQQPEQHPRHRGEADVAADRRPAEGRPDHRVEVDATQVLGEQLQPGIRGQVHVPEVERQIAIDSGLQIGSSLSHRPEAFRSWEKGLVGAFFQPQTTAPFQSG
jgi:hypothetical protein